MDSSNNFEKTVYQSTSNEELEKIYNKEMISFKKNQIILQSLKEINLEHIDNQAIEKALISIQLSSHCDLPANKLLG